MYKNENEKVNWKMKYGLDGKRKIVMTSNNSSSGRQAGRPPLVGSD